MENTHNTNINTKGIKGKSLYDRHNKPVGTISDVMLEPETGNRLYGIVENDPTPDGKLTRYAVPYHSLNSSENEEMVLFGEGSEKLVGSPKYDDSYNEKPDPAYVNKLYAYYGLPEVYEGNKFNASRYQGIGNSGEARTMEEANISGSSRIKRAGIGNPKDRLVNNSARRTYNASLS